MLRFTIGFRYVPSCYVNGQLVDKPTTIKKTVICSNYIQVALDHKTVKLNSITERLKAFLIAMC